MSRSVLRSDTAEEQPEAWGRQLPHPSRERRRIDSALPRGGTTKGGDQVVTSIGSSTSTTPTTTPTTTTDSSLVQTAAGAGSQSIGGLATGLDTNAIIAALVASERALENPIKNQGTRRVDRAAELRADPHRPDDAQHRRRSRWHGRRRGTRSRRRRRTTASRRSPPAAARSAERSRSPSTRSPSAGSIRSTNIITDTTTTVAADASVFVAAGGKALGFSTFRSDDTLAIGAHTITVSQASSAATKNGDSTLAGSTLIDGTNDTLELTRQRHADHAHARARHLHRDPTAARRVQDAADVGRRADHRDAHRRGHALARAPRRQGTAGDAAGHRRQRARRARRSRPTAPRTPEPTACCRSTAAPNQTFSNIEAGQSITLNAAAGTITATLAGGLPTGTVNGQQRQHRRRQPRDRRRQHQRRGRGRHRDRGAGRAQLLPAAAHVEHRRRAQRREHRRRPRSTTTSAAS